MSALFQGQHKMQRYATFRYQMLTLPKVRIWMCRTGDCSKTIKRWKVDSIFCGLSKIKRRSALRAAVFLLYRKKANCVSQGTWVKGKEQAKKDICSSCFQKSQNCDGTPPIAINCAPCQQADLYCVESPQTKQRKRKTCRRCARRRLKCNRICPCDTCRKSNMACIYNTAT